MCVTFLELEIKAIKYEFCDEVDMEVKEAIRRIEEHNRIHFAEEYPRAIKITEALNMAVEALEKQIELEPMYSWGVIYYCLPDYGGEEYGWIPSCPRCTRVIDNFTTRCECGQAIKRNKTYPTKTMN